MEAKYVASLEEALDKWAKAEFVDEGLPGGVYYPRNFIKNMAAAVVAVFDANEDGQKFMRDEA